MAEFQTHYQVLRVAITATTSEIKIAYRRAARVAHPDHGGSAEDFRRITEAFEVLSNPKSRADYDRSFASGRSPGSTSATTAREAGPAAGDFAARARAKEGMLPVFVPAFNQDTPPLLPLTIASRQIHGEPKKRGVFTANARLERERRVVDILNSQILSRFPSARLLNGVNSPVSKHPLDHVLIMGYRIAVVGSLLVPEGAYRWNGISLRNGNRTVEPPNILSSAHALGQLFPECTVSAWTIVLSPSQNPFEPVIDYSNKALPDGGAKLSLLGVSRVARELGGFLAAGASPEVVDLQVLTRLLAAMA